MQGYSIPSFAFCFLKAFLEKAVPFLALLSITMCKPCVSKVGKAAFPAVNVVSQVTCRFSVINTYSSFSSAIYMFHAFSKLLKPKCLWHIAAPVCRLVYLFVVVSWAFAPECSVRSPGLE